MGFGWGSSDWFIVVQGAAAYSFPELREEAKNNWQLKVESIRWLVIGNLIL